MKRNVTEIVLMSAGAAAVIAVVLAVSPRDGEPDPAFARAGRDAPTRSADAGPVRGRPGGASAAVPAPSVVEEEKADRVVPVPSPAFGADDRVRSAFDSLLEAPEEVGPWAVMLPRDGFGNDMVTDAFTRPQGSPAPERFSPGGAAPSWTDAVILPETHSEAEDGTDPIVTSTTRPRRPDPAPDEATARRPGPGPAAPPPPEPERPASGPQGAPSGGLVPLPPSLLP